MMFVLHLDFVQQQVSACGSKGETKLLAPVSGALEEEFLIARVLARSLSLSYSLTRTHARALAHTRSRSRSRQSVVQ